MTVTATTFSANAEAREHDAAVIPFAPYLL